MEHSTHDARLFFPATQRNVQAIG
ncbi:SAM-dependent methyltransferase, partial [Pseudomonas sp. HMWF031]